jgi:hypothetical protein
MTKVIICFFVKINLVQKKKRSNNIKKTHFKTRITIIMNTKPLKTNKLNLSVILLIGYIIFSSDMFIDSNIVNCMEPEAPEMVDVESYVDNMGLRVIIGITIVVSFFLWVFGK